MRVFVSKWLVSLLPAAALVLSGCGTFSKDKNNNHGGGIVNQAGTGCLQGVVIDGLTGKRLVLKNEGLEKGVFALVRNVMIPANALVANSDEEGKGNLNGEYYLCGFPLDETFPLFAAADGYQNFEGEFKVDSTIPQKTTTSQEGDITRSHPTMIANIVLYPVGVETSDLKLTVYHQGARLQDAMVQLKTTGKHVLGENALAPQVRSAPLADTTNKKGEVVFSADKLVLGGVYEYTVLPPNGGSDAQVKTGEVVVGLKGKGLGLAQKPYEISVSLDDSTPAVKLITKSTEASDYNQEGELVLWFDSDVELSPRSKETRSAYLSGAVEARLDNTTATSSVNVTIKGNKVTLKPVWDRVPAKIADKNLAISYQGFVFRAVGETRAAKYFALPATTVRFFDSM